MRRHLLVLLLCLVVATGCANDATVPADPGPPQVATSRVCGTTLRARQGGTHLLTGGYVKLEEALPAVRAAADEAKEPQIVTAADALAKPLRDAAAAERRGSQDVEKLPKETVDAVRRAAGELDRLLTAECPAA